MTERLDDEYVTWLYCQVANENLKNPRKTFWSLFRQLHTKEFRSFVPNDDNRVEDGRALRREFVLETGNPHTEWVDDEGCSFLEMLIALSRRLADDTDSEPAECFWHLLDNIHIRECNDASRYDEEMVDEILDMVVDRTYDYDGHGGLFPLRNAHEDQRTVELWYQMNAYILEQF